MGLVEEVRLPREDKIFGLIDYPSSPRLQKFILLFFGAFAVVFDLYRQLPEIINDDTMKDIKLDPQTWFAVPFMLFATVLEEKRLLRVLCDNFRQIAKEEDVSITKYQLEQMADSGMVKLWKLRILGGLLIVLGWFVLFNILTLAMLYLKEINWI